MYKSGIIVLVASDSKYGDIGWWALPVSIAFIAYGLYNLQAYRKDTDRFWKDMFSKGGSLQTIMLVFLGLITFGMFIMWLFKL